MSDPVVELTDVSKDYRGLRPLRVERLAIAAGERVAVLGLDQVAAEVFVNLLTGATLPDRGEVKVFGRATTAIDDSAAWLALVDRFGIVTERAVLLDALSVAQNLALPDTLDIDPLPDDVGRRAVALAREVALPQPTWSRPVGELDAASRFRVRLARALALGPSVLILEHASASLTGRDVEDAGRTTRAIAARRGCAVVAATADDGFARAVADRVLTLEPSTGRLMPRRRFPWF